MNELHLGCMKIKRPPKIPDLITKIRECINTGAYFETFHVHVRQIQRGIILQDILYVLLHGRHEKSKDVFDQKYLVWNYAVRGWLVDKQELRVIISFDEEDDMIIITAFYLTNEQGL